MSLSHRFSSSAGIAIGPILFVIAILAILAAVMASGNGDYQVAGSEDRIYADILSQANFIRNTISECNLQYKLAVSTGSVAPVSNSNSYGDYPASDTTNGTLVSALLCDPTGTTSLWSDKLMPPPTAGFNPWTYVNGGDSGGRCFWTTPTAAIPLNSPAIVGGLSHVANKFNSSTSYSASTEVMYNPASSAQKFVVWITLPASAGSMNSLCSLLP